MVRSPAERERLRIAFLDTWLRSAVEGSGTAVAIGGLERALRSQGHTVVRIAPSGRGAGRWFPITLRRLVQNSLLGWRIQPAAYDVVVGFDWDGIWVPRGRTPFVCSIKGVIAEERRHERGRVRLLFGLLARLEGSNARRANRVLATSGFCRERIVHHYRVPETNVTVVPEGLDVAEWRAALAAAPPRPDRRPTILCVARQYPRKRVADLIRAFVAVEARLPDACLRIVGDGPRHASLTALAGELGVGRRVTFLGGIPDREVRREYSRCDVFCLPSALEGFGIVFLEAMVAGVPIVSTNASAIPEVVHEGVTGILVPPREPERLAEALLALLTDPERRARFGAAGRKAVEQYDWARVAERFVAAIREVRSSRPPGD